MNIENYELCFSVSNAMKNIFLHTLKNDPQKVLNLFNNHQTTIDVLRHENAYAALKKTRLFKLSNELVSLFKLTDNKPYEDMKLPFPSCFIEAKIPIYGKYRNDDELVTKGKLYYRGLILVQVPQDEELNLGNDKVKLFSLNDAYKGSRHQIKIYGFNHQDDLKGANDIYLSEYDLFGDDASIKKDVFYDKNEANQVRAFVCNFLDFINDPEVEIIDSYPSERKNEIRKRKGKCRIPELAIIRIYGKIKRYIEALKKNRCFSYSHRFWVRGHWRHFKSDYYVNKKGMKEWIKPYIKGNGLLVSKKYLLKKEPEKRM